MPRGNRSDIQNSSFENRKICLAFALYEVLLGLAILSNRMAEIQATRGAPDGAKEFKIDSGYGAIKLIQKSVPAELIEPNNIQLNGINLVTLTAQWERGGTSQSKQIKFYVYRPG